MSSLFNRLKNLKTGSINFGSNEGDTTSISSFDEEGFLCPICHRKFRDTTGLETHYMQAHSQPESATGYSDTNGNKHEETDSTRETVVWKQQFIVSEESRMQLSTELMQQKQRVGDLEEELELLQKQLRSTQTKVIEQSQEIGNLKATKDTYDAQIAMFTDELLTTQVELKEKQNQVDTLYNDLIPRPTNDDVDVLKRELICVQQRMNEMSLEKEQQIEPLRDTLKDIYEYSKRFDQLENNFNQTINVYDELLLHDTSQITSDLHQIKQTLQSTRQNKDQLHHTLQQTQHCLNEKQTEIEQLKQTKIQLETDLEQSKENNQQLINQLENEGKQTESYRQRIESFTTDIHQLEENIEELKQEKNQILSVKIEGENEGDERQNLLRQLTQEKDQSEQQNKDLRKQIKQINKDKTRLQQEFDNISKQLAEITDEENQLQGEKSRLDNQIHSLQEQLEQSNNEKERQITELSSAREESITINQKLEEDLQQVKNNHKMEIERLENESNVNKLELTEKINRLESENSQLKQSFDEQEQSNKSQLDALQNEKNDLEKQIQTNQQTIGELQKTISQFQTELTEKDQTIQRFSNSIHRSINLVRKTSQFIQEKIHTSQANLLTLLEQSEQEFQTLRTQTLEDIREEFTNYLTVVHTIIVENKNKLDKQIEEDHLKLSEEQEHARKQLNQIETERNQLIKQFEEQKQKFENQLAEITTKFSQVSESLSTSIETTNLEREKFEKQIGSLEEELNQTRSDFESRTKKYEMQSSALTENLSTVRTDLKIAHEKLIDYDRIKSEKADLEKQLIVSQEERQNLLERTTTSENRNDKLLFENGQLAKKNSDLESALQEIAREYQGLQIQSNRISERRWVNDGDVHACSKCLQVFTITQRKHHCRSCGNIFCDGCSSRTAVVAAASKKPQRVCEQCFKELSS